MLLSTIVALVPGGGRESLAVSASTNLLDLQSPLRTDGSKHWQVAWANKGIEVPAPSRFVGLVGYE